MLKKIIVPLLVAGFAFAVAFASPVVSQPGWYINAMGNAVQGNITTPGDTPECSVSNVNHLCKVGSAQAYDTQANAIARGNTGKLKYNDL